VVPQPFHAPAAGWLPTSGFNWDSLQRFTGESTADQTSSRHDRAVALPDVNVLEFRFVSFFLRLGRRECRVGKGHTGKQVQTPQGTRACNSRILQDKICWSASIFVDRAHLRRNKHGGKEYSGVRTI
jgi:hypothetical protein